MQAEVVEDLFGQAPVGAGVERGGEGDRVADGHPGVERVALGQVGDAGARLRRQLGDVLQGQFLLASQILGSPPNLAGSLRWATSALTCSGVTAPAIIG